MLTYTMVVSVPESVSQDDLIESIGVDGHGDLMDAEVIFCGPGNLLSEDLLGEDPDMGAPVGL